MTKKAKNILKTSGILVLGLFLGWLIFGGSQTEQTTHKDGDVHTAETIWTCSMHPQIRMNEPGKCPICGMDLIPLTSDVSRSNPNALQMSEDAMKLANVQTMIVGAQDANKELRLNGKVQIDERKLYAQSTHISGRIEQLTINFTGDKVNKGQTLAYLYSPDLLTAQEELLQAFSIKNSQPELFEAAKQKLRNWKIGDAGINKIISSGKLIQQFPITADVSGIVTAKKVELGDYVNRGMTIYEIADLSSLWVLFDVYESDIPWVKVGNKVSYTIQSLPGETFEGTISFVDPFINPQTRVASARIDVKNADNKLKPEMFASGIIKNNVSKSATKDIVIPKSAVMWTGERSIVYIKNSNANSVEFMLREITLGPSLGNDFVVNSGIEVGDEIVTNGTFSVDAAAQLAGKPSMMNPDGGKVSIGHNHAEMDNSDSKNQMNGSQKKASIDDNTKVVLQPIVSEYFKLNDALASDDFKTAKNSSIQLLKLVNTTKMSLFKGEAHNLWMNYQTSINKELEHFTTLEDIRKANLLISNIMIDLVHSFQLNKQTLYVLHCPMANSNKGADWLSNSKEIKNPFYGKSMLTCGEVKEEINK
jgi:Cu(I)/Ag(I) efflux system membrane fusion protein